MLLPLLVFVGVLLGAAGLYLWWVPDVARQRVQALAEGPGSPRWEATLVRLAGPLARLSMPEGDWEHSPLRVRFMQAGIRAEDARLYYFGAKTALPLLMAGLSYGMLGHGELQVLHLLLILSVVALVATYLPNLALWLAVRARRQEIFENFPDATDLLRICMEAGQGMDAALARVAEEMRTSCLPLAEELHLTQLEIRAGVSREQALHHLALRTGVEEIATFALMLKQAERFGTSIGDSLRVYSEELRDKRMNRAEEKAARIPTQLLLPLVVCIFPAIMLVVLGPALIRITRQLLPMLGGQG